MTSKERKKRISKASDKLVNWIGSPNSLFLHTVFFIIMAVLVLSGIDFDKIMLTLTTIVSLEAIYLAIFIQMTVNKNRIDLVEVSEDIDEIQEDIDEIQEDIEEDEKEEEKEDKMLERIEDTLGKLIEEVIQLKKQHKEIKDNKLTNGKKK